MLLKNHLVGLPFCGENPFSETVRLTQECELLTARSLERSWGHGQRSGQQRESAAKDLLFDTQAQRLTPVGWTDWFGRLICSPQ